MPIDPTVHSAAPCRICGEARSDHWNGVCPSQTVDQSDEPETE